MRLLLACMETVAHYHHASPLLDPNHREKPNHGAGPPPSMRFRFRADLLHSHLHLSFPRRACANATKNDAPFRDSRVSCFDNTTVVRRRMATESDPAAIKDNIEKKVKEEEERESKKSPPPPPPEKPEPGDCCGSGCVRCVWDVYYEELEAYNKLYDK
ncbi:hypothetical protein ACOSP7_022752 [Xanthoceras sorbifolium]